MEEGTYQNFYIKGRSKNSISRVDIKKKKAKQKAKTPTQNLKIFN
jgi:hypothetical protein